MPFTVELRADNILKSNTKYRSGGVRGSVIWSSEVVNNGNFANKDVWADNSIEISCPFSTAQNANYIILKFENSSIAGEIVSCGYTNDNNTIITYVLDHYTTAQMTQGVRGGFFTGAMGLCARTNLTYPRESLANQLPEPISGSDLKKVHSEFTEQFNQKINSKYDITQTSNSALDNGNCFVLWISAFAAWAIQKNGGSADSWQILASSPTSNSITNVDLADFTPPASIRPTTLWHGGYTTGVPLVFSTELLLSVYINDMLSNVGVRTVIPKDGISNDGTVRRYVNVDRQYFTSDNLTTEQANEQVEMEMTKIITEQDIFQIMIIPKKIATSPQKERVFFNDEVVLDLDLSNFNPMKDEKITILPDGTIINDYSKSKALTFPYYYLKLKTRIGNEIVITPQLKMKQTSYLNEFTVNFWTQFVGGNTPKLMLSINDYTEEGTPTDEINGIEWNTIYEYPSIAWTSGVSTEQQVAQLSARMHRSANIQTAIIGQSTQGTGFLYGLRGGKAHMGQNLMQKGLSSLGNAISYTGASANLANANTGGFTPYDRYTTDTENSKKQSQDNSNNLISSNPHTIMGEGGTDLLLSSPVTIYQCGFSDGELFSLCRYFDRRGQATNCIINPLTNAGNVFGGNASITSYGGKTYYEFYDIDVTGTMPTNLKNAIQSMFTSGCYLVN